MIIPLKYFFFLKKKKISKLQNYIFFQKKKKKNVGPNQEIGFRFLDDLRRMSVKDEKKMRENVASHFILVKILGKPLNVITF